ncbi:MAG: hypothetical protein AAF719_01895 [Pseudomonadota bacterium]
MSSTPGFLGEIYLPDLGVGAGVALWGFRSCARGGGECCVVVDGYKTAFGEDAPEALKRTIDFARLLGEQGRRRIGLAMPGCARVTADELSIIGALSAAQARNRDLMSGHLTWLLARPHDDFLPNTVLGLADDFARCGLQIQTPVAAPSPYSH